jgi:hypothetical protein
MAVGYTQVFVVMEKNKYGIRTRQEGVHWKALKSAAGIVKRQLQKPIDGG